MLHDTQRAPKKMLRVCTMYMFFLEWLRMTKRHCFIEPFLIESINRLSVPYHTALLGHVYRVLHAPTDKYLSFHCVASAMLAQRELRNRKPFDVRESICRFTRVSNDTQRAYVSSLKYDVTGGTVVHEGSRFISIRFILRV